jgi:hypothetical protein
VKRRRACLLVLGPCLVLAGCSAVAPWERGHLAKPQMAAEALAAQRSVLEHIYESREAAAGRTTAKGGGCGCY